MADYPRPQLAAHAAAKGAALRAIRIASTASAVVPNVAFATPQGLKVLIVASDSSAAQEFQIRYCGKGTTSTHGSGAVATFIWT